jgi:hypothetical protein
VWWLVYVRCEGCENDRCGACRHTQRSLRLKRVFSETVPPQALYGPCRDFHDLIDPSWNLFQFNEASDELFFNFKVDPT